VIEASLYWYCPTITTQGTHRVTKAVLLSPILVFDLEDRTEFVAALLDGQSVVPVECRIATTVELAAGEDELGNPVTLFDGERDHHKLSMEELAIQNYTKLYLDADAPLGSGPALLATDSSARLRCASVEVEVLPATIAQLPDFQAELAYLRWFEDALRGSVYERPPSTHSDELQACRQRMRIRSGLVLPVDCPGSDGEHPGALVLGRQLSASPGRFSASLYTFYPTGRLEAGTILSRSTRWHKDPARQTYSRAIARIVLGASN
jgi:hypothetical protein